MNATTRHDIDMHSAEARKPFFRLHRLFLARFLAIRDGIVADSDDDDNTDDDVDEGDDTPCKG